MTKRRALFKVCFYLLPFFALLVAQERQIRIYGRVTDFSGNPIEGAEVAVKTRTFQDAGKTLSGKGGYYSILLPQGGTYMSLFACKDYATKKLEYWAWNLPAQSDREINPRFDRLEVYALNAWVPQGAYPSLQIYFRPMSLEKAKAAIQASGGKELSKIPNLDLCPEVKPEGLQIKVNGQEAALMALSPVVEAVGNGKLVKAFLLQVELPKGVDPWKETEVTVTLYDKTTGEKGEATLFLPNRSLL